MIPWKGTLKQFADLTAEVHLERSQTPKIEPFAEIVHVPYLLNIFTESAILDIWKVSDYASDTIGKVLLCVQIIVFIPTFLLKKALKHWYFFGAR